MIRSIYFFRGILLLFLFSCSSDDSVSKSKEPEKEEIPQESDFYYGADLSYVNEMEDCGAIYKNAEGEEQDVYKIFKNAGANLGRVRLWHDPQWTNYSNLQDVKKSILRAKANEMQVLLDFHYSDTWADPDSQQIPAGWADKVDDLPALGELLYEYTYNTLNDLANENLLPEIVQLGNEINGMILQEGNMEWPIDWERNAFLLNKAISAVRDFSADTNEKVEIMLHIAQPENGIWWFKEATENGVTDFDWIGLSYYPIWSDYDLNEVSSAFKKLIDIYDKRLMVVETAYPFTLENGDAANNILGEDALIKDFSATEEGQLNYLLELTEVIKSSGGEGLVYWAPAWVSTDCKTLWGTGSHWDNATLFDHEYTATLGMQFYSGAVSGEN